jgi:hypothetical protein
MDVLDLWNECSRRRVSEVARANGMTTQKLVALFDQTGLTGRTPSDPDPAAIAAATAAIRSQWSPEQEKSRWIAARTDRRLVGQG